MAFRVDTPAQREPVEIEPRRMTPARRARVLAAHGNCCAYPGCEVSEALEIDHVIALELGGKDADENLEPLCGPHHKVKTARDLGLIARAKRRKAKHDGTYPPSRAQLRSRGFQPTRNWDR